MSPLHDCTAALVWASESPAHRYCLLAGCKVRSAIFLPAAFTRFRAHGALFAIRDRAKFVGRHSQLHQEILGRLGAAVAQTQVVFRRSALVAVALHDNDGI